MIHPAVVAQLHPFIVTSWHGHRNDLDIPRVVREVWREKFDSRNRRGPARQSNVDLAVLDSKGRLVHWFDAFHREDYRQRESLAQYTAHELKKTTDWLRLDSVRPQRRTLKLPDVGGQSRGVRVFVSLKDNRMAAYRAPVVEVVALTEQDWKPLVWPDEPRTVDAAVLKSWLSQVYPPGMMERTNPWTKEVYKIKLVEGNLLLVAAGSHDRRRYAVLDGTVRLTDEGRDEFSYDGRLQVVLTYNSEDSCVKTLRGVFDGIYPRYDRMHGRIRRLRLQAAFESRPE